MNGDDFTLSVRVAKEVGVERGVILHRLSELIWFVSLNPGGEQINGKWWYRASHDTWSEILFGIFSRDKARRILNWLEKAGYIEVGVFNKDRNDRTGWYTLTDKAKKLLNVR